MLILKANRLGTTARVVVSYPVMFQTDCGSGNGAALRVCFEALTTWLHTIKRHT
jgi:hypothetical protein